MICQDNGKWYEPDAISVKWKRFLKKNNLPLVGMHSCRHAFATLGIAEGVDIASLSRHLGHSQISTTLNQYVSYLDDGIKKVANDMDKVLFENAH